ncbi:adenosylcobinamide-GDP ribazoletransferase [Mycoplasmatota bacterium WC44]
MKTIYQSFQIAISFFTVLPVFKHYEWTSKRMRYVPIMMGIVGLIIGCLTALIYVLLGRFNFEFSELITTVILVSFFTYITGGLHIDALMDSADAHFSRRDIERKLEIMVDSRVGAFAVMSLFFYMIILLLTVFLFVSLKLSYIYLIFIPIYSRMLAGLMNYRFKYAKEDGLARIYGEALKKKDQIVIFVNYIICSGLLFYITASIISLVLPLISILSYHYYFRFTKKNFGGITGDLLGNYILLSELAMLVGIIGLSL